MKLFYVLLGLLIIFIIFQYVVYSTNDKFSNDIDIVITWVECNNSYEKERDFWLKKENMKIDKKIKVENRRRCVDNNELKYALRSIEKYFPHYRYIYLVIKDNQFPSYIKHKHPKLKIIKESKIVPNEYLPTFNSMAVEPYLHHIPGLSDNYLYMNDDFMFIKPVNKSYFIDRENKPTPLHTSDYKRKYVNEYDIDLNQYFFDNGYAINNFILDSIGGEEKEGRYLVSHVPKIFNIKYDYQIENKLKKYYIDDTNLNVYDKTGMSKFRKNSNLYLVSILKEYLYHYLFNRKFKKTNCIFQKVFDLKQLIDLKNKNKEAQFMCINEINSADIEDYNDFMTSLFPEKSSFEK